jgi:hypothetical protein
LLVPEVAEISTAFTEDSLFPSYPPPAHKDRQSETKRRTDQKHTAQKKQAAADRQYFLTTYDM